MTSEKIQGKYGMFTKKDEGTYIYSTCWDLPNGTRVESYRGGPARVTCSKDLLLTGIDNAEEVLRTAVHKYAEWFYRR